MLTVFKNISLEEFNSYFQTEEQCLEYLSRIKWEDGFTCKHCGNDNYCRGRQPYSRRCTKCKHEESATAHTIFHKCKIPLKIAFKIAFIVCHEPEISSYRLSEILGKRQMTCWKFKKKILECIEKEESPGKNPA